MTEGPSADLVPPPGTKEPTKAEQAKIDFEAALAETTASVETLMLKDGALSSGEKYALCRSIGEECIQEQELFNLLDKKPEIIGTWYAAKRGFSARPGAVFAGGACCNGAQTFGENLSECGRECRLTLSAGSVPSGLGPADKGVVSSGTVRRRCSGAHRDSLNTFLH